MKNRLQDFLPYSAETSQQTEEPGGWKGKLHEYLHWAERHIAEHPKAALGVGLVLGVTLGWLTKRR